MMKKKKSSDVKKGDTSPFVQQRQKVNFELNIQERSDLTERQNVILETMEDKNTRCVFIDGFWGTSKSFLSILASLRLLRDKKIDGIIYIRNPVEASKFGKVGILPGTVEEKMAPYMAILYDKLNEMLPKPEMDLLIKDKRIECLPVSFCQGLSWNCKAIIVDEAASMSYDDILLLLSRCGKYTKIFIIGDSANQNSIGNNSGFRKIFEIFNDTESMENGVFTFELRNKDDIVRSGFVKFVMNKVGILPNDL